jgi:hypothetical protein
MRIRLSASFQRAPKWQAGIYCIRSRLYGGLSTPRACSKVSHLHRKHLRTNVALAKLKSPQPQLLKAAHIFSPRAEMTFRMVAKFGLRSLDRPLERLSLERPR